jgi:hypothetical protein
MLFRSSGRLVKVIATPLTLLVAVLLVVNLFERTSNACQQSTYHALRDSVQQGDGWVAIKTAEGVLFVWNRPDIHFTIAIKGAEIKPLDDSEHIFFTVDGKVFQIQLASISQFAADAKAKKLDDKSLLAAHRDWESKYLEDQLGSKLQVQSSSAKLSSGADALLWQFEMPEGMNSDARKQIYLTVVSKDYVLLLNSVATATISDQMAQKFLLDTIATLKISDAPIDVKQLSESIRKESKP